MRINRHKLNSSGVALVTVLVITAVALALGYAALTISLSVLQGSKAAESSVQARLNAESGLDAVLVFVDEHIDSTKTLPRAADINQIPTINGGGGLIRLSDGTAFSLLSVVNREQEVSLDLNVKGESANKAEFLTAATVRFGASDIGENSSGNLSNLENILASGLTMCKSGANMGGSGKILLNGQNLYSAGDFTINSAGTIDGTIVALGTVRVENSITIEGDIRARNIISNNGGAALGNLYAIESIQLDKKVVAGDLRANNITIIGGVSTLGNIYARGHIDIQMSVNIKSAHALEGITANPTTGGIVIHNGMYSNSLLPVSRTNNLRLAGPPDPNHPMFAVESIDFSCANLDIDDDLKNFLISYRDTGAKNLTVTGTNVFQIKTDGIFNGNILISSATLSNEPFGRMAHVYAVNNFSTDPWNPGTIEVDPGLNAIVIVTGSGNNLIGAPDRYVIPESSSLTIITNQPFKVTNGRAPDQELQSTITSDNFPRFSIFSTYSSKNNNDHAIEFTGGSGVSHLLIYAKSGGVKFNSSPHIIGAIVSNTFDLGTGAAKLEHDKNYIGELNLGPPTPSIPETPVVERR